MLGAKLSCLMIVLLVSTSIPVISGSAIPMWEYLSRGEKMSHLYSVFTKQVEDYCSNAGALCRKDLLSHGLKRLHSMTDDDLDILDPYQRGASELIWNNMMSHQTPATETNRNTELSSVGILTSNSYGKNPLFRDTDDDAFTTGFEDVFGNSINSNPIRRYEDVEESSSSLNERYAFGTGLGSATLEQNWLIPRSGPMVVRVKPDGSPVPEDLNRPLPVDEDKEEFRLMQQKLPTLQQISALFQTQRPHMRLRTQ